MLQENKEFNGLESLESKKSIYDGLILSNTNIAPTHMRVCACARYKHSF